MDQLKLVSKSFVRSWNHVKYQEKGEDRKVKELLTVRQRSFGQSLEQSIGQWRHRDRTWQLEMQCCNNERHERLYMTWLRQTSWLVKQEITPIWRWQWNHYLGTSWLYWYPVMLHGELNKILSSQAAYMICMTTQDVVDGHSVDVSPLKWKSYKQERQVNSTLAAETMAVSRGMAEACWMRFFFLEIMHSQFSLEEAKQLQHTIPVVTVTDNKPLFDFARNDVTVSQDKRLMIEMLLMRRDILKNNVVLRWIDTKTNACGLYDKNEGATIFATIHVDEWQIRHYARERYAWGKGKWSVAETIENWTKTGQFKMWYGDTYEEMMIFNMLFGGVTFSVSYATCVQKTGMLDMSKSSTFRP